jgi:hypothetical protein
MRTFGLLFVWIAIFFGLQGCASSRAAEELQSGKISFDNGNFKSAFHKLLPLASEGNAAAEYAIGYMYYYGYGTTQDSESGLFWMHKSAEQNYQPAIKALEIIKQNKVSEEPTQQLTAEESIKTMSDQILRTLASNTQKSPAAQSSLSTTRAAANPDVQHQKKFTLQLMGSYRVEDITQTQHRLHIENTSQCVRTQRNGRDWYILAYGKYPASYLAQLALNDLPAGLREMKPWVRQLDNQTFPMKA